MQCCICMHRDMNKQGGCEPGQGPSGLLLGLGLAAAGEAWGRCQWGKAQACVGWCWGMQASISATEAGQSQPGAATDALVAQRQIASMYGMAR